MGDLVKSNLEPLEDKDFDLEGKLKGVESHSHESADVFTVEREAPKEILAAEKDDSYSQVLSKIQTANDNQSGDVVANDAKQIQQMDSQTHVQQLVDMAMQKGVVHAINVAKHMDDNFVLDSFHDKLLSDQLHEALKAKGMIKEF